jgi:hypothetical protein
MSKLQKFMLSMAALCFYGSLPLGLLLGVNWFMGGFSSAGVFIGLFTVSCINEL